MLRIKYILYIIMSISFISCSSIYTHYYDRKIIDLINATKIYIENAKEYEYYFKNSQYINKKIINQESMNKLKEQIEVIRDNHYLYVYDSHRVSIDTKSAIISSTITEEHTVLRCDIVFRRVGNNREYCTFVFQFNDKNDWYLSSISFVNLLHK